MTTSSEHTITGTEETIQSAEDIAAALAVEEKAAQDLANGVETPSQDRPDWLPEKFNSAEDMAKAYSELEKKQSTGTPQQEEAPEGLGISKQDAEAAAQEAGVDFDSLAAKYSENGKLDEADYEAMEKAGLKRETVDTYIKGQEAIAAQYEAKVLEQFGDKQAYQTMLQWASTNLSEAMIDMFNEATSSGDVDRAMFAINGLKAQYVAANGNEPARVVNGKPSQSGPRYENEAEYIKDMEHPDYWKDPAYRARVDRKFDATWGT